MNRTLLFILSSNYSGSHYLSLLLGSHSQATHLGEVKNLAKAKHQLGGTDTPESTRHCHLCGSNQECRLFRGLHLLEPDEIYPTLFHRAGTSLLVDTSKKFDWAARHLTGEYEVRFLHLLRDPRALVRKWHQQFPDRTAQLRQRWKEARIGGTAGVALLWRPEWQLWLHKWLRQNREITDFLAGRREPHRLLSYRDLARAPAATLQDLMGWLGFDYEPAQLRYWEHEHHGSIKPRYAENPGEGFIDLRWQSELPAGWRNGIAADAGLLGYLERVGLRMCDDGLSRGR